MRANHFDVIQFRNDHPKPVHVGYLVFHLSNSQNLADLVLTCYCLSGIVSMIMIRTLRRDIARYNKEDEMVCYDVH